MPLLSVITINYNNAAGLEKTIQSVISQRFKDFEYIVIDGGSTDGSADIIKKYQDKITCWVSEKDTGIYNAMNKGIKKATGTYCLFLNSGDNLIDAQVLQKVFGVKRNHDILYGEIIFENLDGKTSLKTVPEQITPWFLFNGNIWHPSAFIKRHLFSSIGLYKEEFKIAADYDFFFHSLIYKKVSRQYLPFPVSVYDNSTGVSVNPANLTNVVKERNLVQKTYLPQLLFNFYNFLYKINNLYTIRRIKNVFKSK